MCVCRRDEKTCGESVAGAKSRGVAGAGRGHRGRGVAGAGVCLQGHALMRPGAPDVKDLPSLPSRRVVSRPMPVPWDRLMMSEGPQISIKHRRCMMAR